MTRAVVTLAVLMVGALVAADAVQAQPLGAFRWQQEPYCNVITLSIVQVAGVYQLNGFDDECGAAARSAVTGTAFLNPDGTIGMGLTVVPAGGVSFDLDARLALSPLMGA